MSTMDAQAFLDLLARDAAPVEFERPVLDARSAGADPAELAALERAKISALRVRATLDERRRREVELSALVDTASDLAALRDVDAVLSAIVHRARGLLGADIAYLSYSDPDRGDTYMRVTDGSVSARFQKLRLPMGAGLGGLVAQTATPYVTANYIADERFRHTSEIDTAVREEGLVAILGVPLLLGSRVLGVLYAANRSERPFSREEVALLVTLAAHAAVAIDTARLLEETRAALAELERANELVRTHSAAVERAAEAHDELTDLVLLGGGVEEVAIAIGRVLDGPLCVLDGEGRQLAAVGDVHLPQAAQLTAAMRDSQQGGRAVPVDGCWVAGVVAGAQHLGALVLGGQPQLGDADQRVLERAAVVTALLLLMRRSVADAEIRVRGELLTDLLDSASQDDADVLRERAKRVGIDLDAPHAVVVAEMREPVARERLAFAAAQVATQRGGLASGRGRTVVLLLPGAEPGPAAAAVSAELTP
ncbi:MAG: GAF domain-containing protein, partial [Jiangellaceae bacterium]